MFATAKLFKTGNSQAVRLPKAFRVAGDEVWIRKNAVTGEIVLTPKPTRKSLEEFFSLLEAAPLQADFLTGRDKDATGEIARNPLEGWQK